MGRSSWRNAIADDSNAAPNSNGGNRTASTRSGPTSKAGTPEMNETANPASTNNNGEGTPSRRARLVTSSTPTSSPMTGRLSSMGSSFSRDDGHSVSTEDPGQGRFGVDRVQAAVRRSEFPVLEPAFPLGRGHLAVPATAPPTPSGSGP